MTPVHKKVRRFGIPKIVFHLKIKKTLKYFINFFLIRKKKNPCNARDCLGNTLKWLKLFKSLEIKIF